MLINRKLLSSRDARLMMSKDKRLVTLMKLIIAMIVVLFSLPHPACAQDHTLTPGNSDPRVSPEVSAKSSDITGKGCDVGFYTAENSTSVFNQGASVFEVCGKRWAISYSNGIPVKPLQLICEQTGGLTRKFPSYHGWVIECIYKN